MPNKRRTEIPVVAVLPALASTQVGDIFFLTADDKIYIRLITGWKSTAALT